MVGKGLEWGRDRVVILRLRVRHRRMGRRSLGPIVGPHLYRLSRLRHPNSRCRLLLLLSLRREVRRSLNLRTSLDWVVTPHPPSPLRARQTQRYPDQVCPIQLVPPSSLRQLPAQTRTPQTFLYPNHTDHLTSTHRPAPPHIPKHSRLPPRPTAERRASDHCPPLCQDRARLLPGHRLVMPGCRIR